MEEDNYSEIFQIIAPIAEGDGLLIIVIVFDALAVTVIHKKLLIIHCHNRFLLSCNKDH